MSRENTHQDLTTPSEIATRRREDSYQLELPPELPDVHNVFHASQPWKYFQLPDKPDLYKDIDHQAIDPYPNLTYRELPISSLDQEERHTRSHTIKYPKVQWSTTRKQKQHEDLKTTPDPSFCTPFRA